ncbi:carboxypeptidase-like regulatory domain-containing protein [Acidobacteria bacterium AH-259-A15]|nr:carboxypeptidase-like regulatory domain-containing protein [Acidobacteria bacterium AH-259-A15]
MKTKRGLYAGRVGVGIAVFLAVAMAGMSARQLTGEAVRIDNDDLGGVVTSADGPEAGVWVIAETMDLPTRFVKIAVTDDRGRYVVPDLPKANYNVWARGYGLVDSPKVRTAPGKIVNLATVPAPNRRAAAQYYPAGYWFSLIQVPDKSEFPGTGPQGNGISPNMKSQAQWLRVLKSGNCMACHQLGNKATREIPAELGEFDSLVAAWNRRIQSGQAGGSMINGLNAMGRQRALEMFADWTGRITAGEVPLAPPRPQGVERNVVITQWDWADPKAYLHDEISTDKRNPTVNANGPIYGALEASADYVPVLDPVRHTASQAKVPVRDPDTPVAAGPPLQPSPYWGNEAIWTSRANVHNPMLDHKGRVWLTSRVRPSANPPFCQEGSDHPSAKLFPTGRASRHLAVYDPSTEQFTLISTCFGTHHLVFAEDANHTLWTSGGGQVIGWLNTKMFDETGDEEKSQGWTALILDTNGNGKRDAYVEPGEPVDPTKDKRISSGYYGVAVSPVDGSIWGSSLGFPGSIIRLDPGPNPPETALTEIYELPWGNPKAHVQGFSPRGMDIDRNGVVWTPLASGHLASFDRRNCTGPLNGPTATGQHCPEGWTLYPEPLPQLKGLTDSGSAEASYYTWVDQFDTLGLGRNVPINTGNGSEGLLALKDGKWVVMRVPYPLGFYTKWMDGRIDDPNAGWKGRGLWATWSTRAPFHSETGKGTTSKVVKFQLRPDPLAK